MPAVHEPDARDDPGARRLAVVEPVGGQRRDLQERAAVVEEHVDPLAREQLAAGHVPVPRALRAAVRRGAEPVLAAPSTRARWDASFAANEVPAGSAAVLSISIDAVSAGVVGETN